MEYREDLKAFIDGELPPARAESIRKAAESDPALQSEIDELRAVGQALQEMRKDPEPQGLEQTLMALSGHPTGATWGSGRRKPWLGFAWGVGLAAVFALVVAIPSLLNRPAASNSGARLASMTYQKQAATGSRQFLNGRPAAAAAPANGAPTKLSGPARPLTLEEQVKQQQQQIQDLQKQIVALKGKGAGSLPSDSTVMAGPALPAPPLSGTIVPGHPGDGTMADANVAARAKGLSPTRISDLEAQVRKLAAGAGGKVEATGPPVMRSVVVTIDTPKAAALAAKVRGVLKDAGTVTVEDIPPVTDDARTQATQDRIVELKIQREKLLQDFLPEAPQVRDLDTQIKILQESIKPNQQPPKSRIHIAIG